MSSNRSKTGFGPVSCIAIAIALSLSTSAFAQSTPTATETPAATVKTDGWGVAVNDLTPDPSIRLGVLPNGMKYALKRNETPKGATSVRLTIDAGRQAELEGEQGLAHFLEHMAFRGSTNIPDGELLKKLERLGLKFGPDTNAETAPDYTRYKLDLPRSDDEMIDTALFIMRETAGEMSLSRSAVDKERGVILAEAPTRDTPDIRNLQAYFNNAAPDSKLGKSIYTDDLTDVKNAPAETLRRFYERNYRPEKATLVLVGDFDIDAVEKKLVRQFEDWRGKGKAGGNSIGPINADQPVRFGNYVNAGIAESVEIARVAPSTPVQNSVAEAKQALAQLAWQFALNKRFETLARSADAPIAAGLAVTLPISRSVDPLSISITTKDGNWQAALQTAEQEYRRAAEHGFNKDEVEGALLLIRGFFQSLVQGEASRLSVNIATELSDNALSRSVTTVPSELLRVFDGLKDDITPTLVHSTFKADWGSGPNYIHLASKAPVDGFADKAMALLTESRAVAVAPLVEAKAVQFAYTDFGKAGQIAKDTRNAALDIRTLSFRNGVMLNIKKTDFQPGIVHFAVRVGSGLAAQKTMIAGLPFFLDQTSPRDGLAAHSIEELDRIIAGRRVKLGLTARQRDVASIGSVSKDDLLFQMQLAAATVTSFGFRPESDQAWKSIAPALEDQLLAGPNGIFQSKVLSVLANDDPRIANSNIDGLSDRNMAELKNWLKSELESGPIEITLVGDVDEAVAIATIAKTFGALPKRGKAKPTVGLSFPKELTPRILTHKGKDDQAMLLFGWPIGDDSDQRSMAARDLLAGVLQNEMRAVLREKLGATYTPEAVSVPANAFPGYGVMFTLVTTTPENMDVVKKELMDIIARLSADGTNDDALLRVRQPILERFAAQDRQNASWLSAISDAQTRPERLDRRLKRKDIWASITPADIQKAAQQYLGANKALEIRIVSEAVAVSKR
jgi:zinc protease